MPNRVIRDGINSSERLNAVSAMAELHFRRLMTVVDDYGRCEASPRVLKGLAWGMRDGITTTDCEEWTLELASGDRPLILLYEVDGKQFLQIQDFGQRIRCGRDGKPAPSRCPDPPPQTQEKAIVAATRGDARRKTEKTLHVAATNTKKGDCRGDTRRNPSQTLFQRPVDRSSEIVVRSSEAVTCESGGAAAAAASATQTKAAAEPCGDPCADADTIAWSLASDLAAAHASFQPGRVTEARVFLERLLAESPDPAAEAARIRESHRLYCLHWSALRRQRPGAFVPQLPRWIADGDHLAPPQPPQQSPGGTVTRLFDPREGLDG